jgi:hypothetical protein
MTDKSQALIDELVAACIAFGRQVEPDWQTRIEKAQRELREYIDELEAAQRWRVVANGELPEVYRNEDGEFIPFLVCEGDGDRPFIAMYNGINWWAGIFVPDVTHWMPLPPNPESPNDTQSSTIVYGKEGEE